MEKVTVKKVTVIKAALMTGHSPPKIYKDMAEGKLPFSRNKSGTKVIDPNDLEAFYGLEIEELQELRESRITIEHLNDKIDLMQNHLDLAHQQLETEKARNDTLLRILDPDRNSPTNTFLDPFIDFFKQ